MIKGTREDSYIIKQRPETMQVNNGYKNCNNPEREEAEGAEPTERTESEQEDGDLREKLSQDARGRRETLGKAGTHRRNGSAMSVH